MYSVQQLQAIDYLLKKEILSNKGLSPFYDKNLKLLVYLNNEWWYGDFIRINNGRVYEFFIDDSGEVEIDYLDRVGSNATAILKSTWDTYRSSFEGMGYNPFTSIKDPALLCNTLIKVVNMAEITQSSSPLLPCLHNAVNFKNKEERLPFIQIGEKSLELISIIEVP